MKEIQLGDEVEDIISGFRGIAEEKDEFIDGSITYGVRPKADKEDAKRPKVEYIPSTHLKKVGDGVRVKRVKTDLGFRA